VVQASTTQAAVAKPIPLPEARPNIKPVRELRRRRAYRYYRRGR
jgi:membrane-bound lytic murein transglycosylase A